MQVLVSDPIAEEGLSILKQAGLEVVYLPEATAEEKKAACKSVHGWIIRSGTKVTADMIDHAEHLRVIGRAGVGVDNIEIAAATRKGVVVMNTPDVNTISAAEHTVALMLALSRNIPRGHRELMEGQWNRNALVGSELHNKTLGIVGLGKIGRGVMQRCRAFGMTILGYDPYIGQDLFNQEEVSMVDLDSLTQKADYITLHVPLNDSTRDLFNYERFSTMKPTARIVNVARGGIINEADLAKALNEDIICGAAIDVFAAEPLGISHPLVKAKNVVLTPHLGASTHEARAAVSLAVCSQVRDYLLHEKMVHTLNMPISDMAKLYEIQHHLDLAEIMGCLLGQLAKDSVKKIHIGCAGTIDKSKLVALAFLKGLLKNRVEQKVNYINAETLAAEQGMEVEHNYTSDSGSYTNLVKSTVKGAFGSWSLTGSVFGGDRLRLVNILGFEMDVTPVGNMLFSHNKDVPGVIGKVGSILGEAKINIGAYFLSRNSNNGVAFSVICVDNAVPDEVLYRLASLPEITDIQQLEC